MKVAIISPIPLLEQYATLGDKYHLVLTHLVHQSEEYADFYRKRSHQGDYIILDNSAHEFGLSEKIDALLSGAEKVKASEVTLPDRLFFGDDTLKASKAAAVQFRKRFPKMRLMGVPQGRTLGEFHSCLLGLIQLGVETIGISKDYEVWSGGLPALVRHVNRFGPNLNIHMLGWGRDLYQLKELAYMSRDFNIRGIDSAKPLVYAATKLRLDRNGLFPPYPGRPKDFFFENTIDSKLAENNIDVFKRMAK